MSLRKTLIALATSIADEAERNPKFREHIENALGSISHSRMLTEVRPKRGRRTAAVLDPVELARQSEDELRKHLEELDLDQLRDIIAQYGMDPSKLVMKWKDRLRIINRIIEVSVGRATKGDAFRGD